MQCLAIFFGCLIMNDSHAVESGQPVALSGTVEWEMKDDRGKSYRIMISHPEGGVPSSGGYPVLYVLDANAYFASFHSAKRSQEPFRQAIIVGIGYPGKEPLNFLRRSYDFSPPVSDQPSDPPQGGQDELLDFLKNRVMPTVADRLPVDADRQALFGHSFGGMFAIYAFFTQPGMFDHVVAASPSLWWHEYYLLEPERDFRESVKEGKIDAAYQSLALILAERDPPQVIQDAQALQQRLQPLSAWGMRSSVYVESDSNHMSVPFQIESRVLREVLSARSR